jgi:hypothetical protein
MDGMVISALEGKYWCSICNDVHTRVAGSEECVFKTGWHIFNSVTYNVGFCNGVHRDPNAPKHLGGQGVIKEPSEF